MRAKKLTINCTYVCSLHLVLILFLMKQIDKIWVLWCKYAGSLAVFVLWFEILENFRKKNSVEEKYVRKTYKVLYQQKKLIKHKDTESKFSKFQKCEISLYKRLCRQLWLFSSSFFLSSIVFIFYYYLLFT